MPAESQTQYCTVRSSQPGPFDGLFINLVLKNGFLVTKFNLAVTKPLITTLTLLVLSLKVSTFSYVIKIVKQLDLANLPTFIYIYKVPICLPESDCQPPTSLLSLVISAGSFGLGNCLSDSWFIRVGSGQEY